MQIDYRESALRHWSDAEHLKNDRRHGNADQLYGLAAECALKETMASRGAATTAEGDLAERRHWIHIESLWNEFQAFASGRGNARLLGPLTAFRGGNPFADWSIARRYAADQETPRGPGLNRHRKAARACLTVMTRAAGAP